MMDIKHILVLSLLAISSCNAMEDPDKNGDHFIDGTPIIQNSRKRTLALIQTEELHKQEEVGNENSTNAKIEFLCKVARISSSNVPSRQSSMYNFIFNNNVILSLSYTQIEPIKTLHDIIIDMCAQVASEPMSDFSIPIDITFEQLQALEQCINNDPALNDTLDACSLQELLELIGIANYLAYPTLKTVSLKRLVTKFFIDHSVDEYLPWLNTLQLPEEIKQELIALTTITCKTVDDQIFIFSLPFIQSSSVLQHMMDMQGNDPFPLTQPFMTHELLSFIDLIINKKSSQLYFYGEVIKNPYKLIDAMRLIDFLNIQFITSHQKCPTLKHLIINALANQLKACPKQLNELIRSQALRSLELDESLQKILIDAIRLHYPELNDRVVKRTLSFPGTEEIIFSPQGTYCILVQPVNKSFSILNPKSGDVLFTSTTLDIKNLKLHTEEVKSFFITFDLQEHFLSYRNTKNNIVILNLDTMHEGAMLHPNDSTHNPVGAFSPCGTKFAYSTSANSVALFDIPTQDRSIIHCDTKGLFICNLAFSPDNKNIAFAARGTGITAFIVYNLETQSQIHMSATMGQEPAGFPLKALQFISAHELTAISEDGYAHFKIDESKATHQCTEQFRLSKNHALNHRLDLASLTSKGFIKLEPIEGGTTLYFDRNKYLKAFSLNAQRTALLAASSAEGVVLISYSNWARKIIDKNILRPQPTRLLISPCEKFIAATNKKLVLLYSIIPSLHQVLETLENKIQKEVIL